MVLNCGAGEDLRVPLNFREIKPVNSKGNQPWMFIGMATAEALILRPTNAKSQLIGKDLNAGKDRRERTGQQRMRRLDGIKQLNGHESEQTPRDSKRNRSLMCYHGVAKSWTQLSNWITTTNLGVKVTKEVKQFYTENFKELGWPWGDGMGREGQDGKPVYTHGWFMWMYGKNHHNIVK